MKHTGNRCGNRNRSEDDNDELELHSGQVLLELGMFRLIISQESASLCCQFEYEQSKVIIHHENQ